MMSTTSDSSDLRRPDPSGCRWCGVNERDHMQRWKPPVGWHQWAPPTQQQRKERMKARRARPETARRDSAIRGNPTLLAA